MRRQFLLFILFYLASGILFFTACKKDEAKVSTAQDAPVSAQIKLTSLPSSQTGIAFNNKINDEGRINIFTWHFIYNGAGVAAGDINNDGLPDLYFAGNMAPNKPYLNKSDSNFEDITSKSAMRPQTWSIGFTM